MKHTYAPTWRDKGGNAYTSNRCQQCGEFESHANHRDRSNCRLIKRKVAGYTAYFFAYSANADLAFEFSMLCEVGQPWIPTFEAIIAEKGLDLVTVEVDERPWVITIAQ